MYEKTFVLIKPDTMERGLTGRIIQIFEDRKLDILAAKLLDTNKHIAMLHYTQSKPKLWSEKVGNKTKEVYSYYGINVKNVFGTTDSEKIGDRVRKWSIEYLAKGKVLALILGGPHAIESAKKIIGPTEPYKSSLETIRGMFGTESYVYANVQGRAVHNVVHRSTSKEEATREIAIWFKQT